MALGAPAGADRRKEGMADLRSAPEETTRERESGDGSINCRAAGYRD